MILWSRCGHKERAIEKNWLYLDYQFFRLQFLQNFKGYLNGYAAYNEIGRGDLHEQEGISKKQMIKTSFC